MSDQNKIAELMRLDWNRRVSHDYRFWMSDGHASDEEMWQTGARDLEIVTDGIEGCSEKTFLEVGCGVGRMLRAAAGKFRKVIGIDVSDEAIARARDLLKDCQTVKLEVGNGIDLSSIPSGSVDVAISFAAITSMPTEVIAGYLREIHRVLSPTGIVRLQMYLGTPQTVSAQNTLTLRCFSRDNFASALAAAGFRIQSIRELLLPIQVSAAELGIEAVVVSLERLERRPSDSQTIARLLLPEGEPVDEQSEHMNGGVTVKDLEYWMTLNYAKDLLAKGDFVRARAALNYALTQCQGTTVDAKNLIDELTRELNAREGQVACSEAPPVAAMAGSVFERNLRVLERRFPEVAKLLKGMPVSWPGVEVRVTDDGPVIFEDGQCLDHASKPRSAAESWSRRLLQEPRMATATDIVVFGFGAGYHIEELLKSTDKKVSVIEPRPESFGAAARERDLTSVLESIQYLEVGKSDSLSCFTEGSELVIRPQTQVVSGAYCAAVRGLAYGKRGLTALHPKIAVLGPLQGGTLPIAAYVSKSLGELKQRVRGLDVSGFASGYHVVEDLLTDRARRSLAQGRYLEMVSNLVLDSYNEKPFDILLCMAQAPVTGNVLSELRKRGVITVLWFVEDYLRFGYWKEMAKFYDFVFTIQRGECIEAIKAAGAGEVHYLPTACDPDLHRPMELASDEKERWGSKVSFVGAGYHNRQQVFASLSNMPFKIWGTEWPSCKPFDRLVQEQGRRLTPGEYIKIFNSTEINLNLHSSSERDGVDPFGDFVNPRTFELAACGAFQLVDERELLPENFEAGSEIVTFKTPNEMREKIRYYLEHPEEARAIAERGRQRALRDHTYSQRLRSMLLTIYASKFEQLKRREDNQPWQKMLARSAKYPELQDRCKRAFERGEEPNLDGLISDIVTGQGRLTETEQKLLFLFHIRKQTIRMAAEERGEKV